MNPHQYPSADFYRPAGPSTSDPGRLLEPELPRPVSAGITTRSQNAPVFMHPLLPPQPVLSTGPNPPPPPYYSPPESVVDYPSPNAFREPSSSGQSRQLQPQEQDWIPHEFGNSVEACSLEFSSIEAFHRWRSDLEERDSVEFVKAGRCQSTTAPSCFDEVTRLVCSRHYKSARDKYTNTLHERTRGSPNRKIEGEACPAFITYKAYPGTPTIRAIYFDQHSHPIGPENLPFTQRGRKRADYERKMRHQTEISRTNGVFNGMASSSPQDSYTSKNSESTGSNSVPGALRIEPPPMASLKPPEAAPEYSASGAAFTQGQTDPGKQYSKSGSSSRQTAFVSPPVHQLTPVYQYINGDNLPSGPPSTTNSENTGYVQVYSVPRAPPQLPYSHDTRVHQPQPTYLSQSQMLPIQSQYLPTPTTPSSRVQNLQSYPPPPHPDPLYQGESRGYVQPPVPMLQAAHSLPISPVTPNAQHHPGPSINPSLPQYTPQAGISFDEDRWNHLETLFQAVRLRARTYTLREPAITTLESLLSELYMEGQQGYPRYDAEQDRMDQTGYQRQ